ncbi:hypothetical protein [Thiospirillum jenense]|uniref:Uncharacterized protein n=1 Tax=Thiospirillum jenense TaxID=1653858 RepID=A0A839HMJ9_9GAMM|nr:hypothetical protein [Thiospirillum jenense]MBB1127409.1 hypothetical protein [Thiospirillum jenense]
MPASTDWRTDWQDAIERNDNVFLTTRATVRLSAPPSRAESESFVNPSSNRQITSTQSATSTATAPRSRSPPTQLQFITDQSPPARPLKQSTLEQWFSIANLQAIKRVIVDLF